MGAGKIIEGYWDCPQCGSEKIKGRHRYCNSCGKPRGKETQFYMIETDNYVDDISNISKDPDWYCSYCESLNPANSLTCDSCGSSQEESDKNYFMLLEEAKQKAKENKTSESIYAAEETYAVEETYNHSNIYEKNSVEYNEKSFLNHEDAKEKDENLYHQKKSFNLFKSAGIFIPILLALAFLISFIIPKETTLHVTNKSWTRNIEIQEYKTVEESDWNIPSGGRLAYSQQEIHHYNSIIDHYKTVTEEKSESYISGYETYVSGHRDLGNGYFEEVTSSRPIYDTRYWTETHNEPVYVQVPVMQTKYYYDIERWVHKEYEKSSGNDDEPYWPDLNLIEKEREGTRSEKYSIDVLNKKNKTKTYHLELKEWKLIKTGDNLNVRISAGSITEIISIN